MAYDAENRQVSATDNTTHAVEKYFYDGAGERVEKTGPGGTTVFVYDAQGLLAAEYSTAANTAPCTTCYLTWDHLGSVRMVTDQNGSVVARHDYLPFGEEIPANTAGRGSQWGSITDVEQKFTGQIRDSETNVDYFNARYFGAALGRFTSPDPGNAGADLTNPQSWNGYAYVLGNPLNGVDLSGMDSCDGSNNFCGQGAPSNMQQCQENLSSCWQNPSLYGQYVEQQMFQSSNDPVRGWDPFSVMHVGASVSASSGSSGGSQQSATITWTGGGGSQTVMFDPILNFSPTSMAIAGLTASSETLGSTAPAKPENLEPTALNLNIDGKGLLGKAGTAICGSHRSTGEQVFRSVRNGAAKGLVGGALNGAGAPAIPLLVPNIMGSLELGAEAGVVGGPVGVITGALIGGAVGAASGVVIGLAKSGACKAAGF